MALLCAVMRVVADERHHGAGRAQSILRAETVHRQDSLPWTESPADLGADSPSRAGASRGTIVAMSTEALRTVKDRLSEFVDRVQRQHERVVITRNGTPAAVLISAEDLEALEETLDVLSDRAAMRELREAKQAVASGDVVRGVEAIRQLRGS